MDDFRSDFATVRFKTLTDGVVRIVVDIIAADTENENFQGLLNRMRASFASFAANQTRFCMVFCLSVMPTDFDKVRQVVSLMREHRETIRSLSITTAMVTNSLTQVLLKFVFALYTPVGEVETFSNVRDAKQFVRDRARWGCGASSTHES